MTQRNAAGSKALGIFLKERRLAAFHWTKSLGPYLRATARLGKPITQEEVAEVLDVSRTWYALLESGAVRASTALLSRIGNAFSLDAEQRAHMLSLALPELATDGPTALPKSDLSLRISSPDEIEQTARSLAAAREQYLRDGTIPTRSLRPRVRVSWDRCLPAVDPTQLIPAFHRSDELSERRERRERLVWAAAPVIDFLANRLGGLGYAVVITDEGGCILSMDADPAVRRRLAAIDFEPGSDWCEASAGTNAIGTSLVDGRPVQLLAAEHFCEGWTDYTCTAAPVRCPETLEVIGTLDVTGRYPLVRSHLLPLIMACALEIEERLAIAPAA